MLKQKWKNLLGVLAQVLLIVGTSLFIISDKVFECLTKDANGELIKSGVFVSIKEVNPSLLYISIAFLVIDIVVFILYLLRKNMNIIITKVFIAIHFLFALTIIVLDVVIPLFFSGYCEAVGLYAPMILFVISFGINIYNYNDVYELE